MQVRVRISAKVNKEAIIGNFLWKIHYPCGPIQNLPTDDQISHSSRLQIGFQVIDHPILLIVYYLMDDDARMQCVPNKKRQSRPS